jgi:hypothetical protein
LTSSAYLNGIQLISTVTRPQTNVEVRLIFPPTESLYQKKFVVTGSVEVPSTLNGFKFGVNAALG